MRARHERFTIVEALRGLVVVNQVGHPRPSFHVTRVDCNAMQGICRIWSGEAAHLRKVTRDHKVRVGPTVLPDTQTEVPGEVEDFLKAEGCQGKALVETRAVFPSEDIEGEISNIRADGSECSRA